MYQLLSLTKRVEAAEVGMAKMASMIEDLARESGGAGGGKTTAQVKGVRK